MSIFSVKTWMVNIITKYKVKYNNNDRVSSEEFFKMCFILIFKFRIDLSWRKTLIKRRRYLENAWDIVNPTVIRIIKT